MVAHEVQKEDSSIRMNVGAANIGHVGLRSWKIVVTVAVTCMMAVAVAQTKAGLSAGEIKQKAEAGDVAAQFYYAQMLMIGQGVEKDDAEALKWYRKAADGGNANAQANMGVFCQTGGLGMTKDIGKAVEWFSKAAAQGCACAQYCLSRLYESGNGVPKNMVKAVELCSQAASQGDANAQYHLSWFYESGDGVEKNLAKATEWCGKAANGGLTEAMLAYAKKLAKGEGCNVNVDEAMKWAEKARANGDKSAPKLVAVLKEIKASFDKTPKSLLGVEFGAPIESWEKQAVFRIGKSNDGKSVEISMKSPRTFRRFAPSSGLMKISGTISSHKVYGFAWGSEDFKGKDRQQEMAQEAKKTCEIIAKKFGGQVREVEHGFRSSYEATVGFLKVVVETRDSTMLMTVTNTIWEEVAQREYKALKETEGDGADAL